MQASVALVIPVFNDQEGLDKTLGGLPAEEFVDIVIVDDGSVPNARAPDWIVTHRVIILRLAENRGIVAALNRGMHYVLEHEYTYLARLDAGDLTLPGRIQKQAAFLDAHLDYGMVGGQARFVDEAGQELYRERFPTNDSDIRRVMHARNCFIHPAVMMRCSVLRKVGPYRRKFENAEDFDLFMRILDCSRVANLDDEVVSCHVNPRGISRQRRRSQIFVRLKVMLGNFNPFVMESYLGLVKNSLLLFFPVVVVQRIKRILGDRRTGWL